MSDPINIEKVMSRIRSGEMRIPGFQRKFVWQPQQAALLMDSIYKGYPFGSILLWRTGNMLKTEKNLGGFGLPAPEKDYPIDYVLDGQQRITSLFATFQNGIAGDGEDPEVWLPIYYDFDATDDVQDPRFVALASDAVDSDRHFPLKTFFHPVNFSRAAQQLPEARFEQIVTVQQRFVAAAIPVQTFESEDRTSVAIVFERVNRLGVELDMFQLLTAWTWSDDFDLQEQFEALADEFSDFGFEDVGADNDLMLRCAAAVLVGDPAPSALIDVNGAEVRARFEEVVKALRLAIDFVRNQLHIRHLKFLPYSALLVPLTAYFSTRQNQTTPDSDRRVLLRWIWRTSFSHRYSGNPLRNVRSDVEEAIKLRKGDANSLDAIRVDVPPAFFLDHAFRQSNVASKCLILMLAGRKPRTFLSGTFVDLGKVLSEPNRREYHHCFPQKYLINSGTDSDTKRISALANIAFISRVDNRTILAKAPSDYRSLMPTDIGAISEAALLPDSLFTDNWDLFLVERADLLASEAQKLIA
ncbi:DUF262 domain-containing protein [Conyzicola nivalis]|uniref:GmrSD restriction endonucleases N-terminal domain-containing protein n=1 Tax=Conyzicola nivalis TaxID=1477021 RepID=A0A916WEQ6_9MICO|nr:DUF262 domain-containing protein [Conyzicola nivalis]GGA91032.1 hypothetical protein GCM10010979_02130 [Conyzicola nivalis]